MKSVKYCEILYRVNVEKKTVVSLQSPIDENATDISAFRLSLVSSEKTENNSHRGHSVQKRVILIQLTVVSCGLICVWKIPLIYKHFYEVDQRCAVAKRWFSHCAFLPYAFFLILI